MLCQSVSLSVMHMCHAKTAERIEVLFGVVTSGSQKDIVLDGRPDLPTARGVGK